MSIMKGKIVSIGIIHSPYSSRAEAPSQGSTEVCEIEISEQYQGGLQDIEGFSHLHILYLLHRSQGFTLKVQTPWDTLPHGLFATRSPRRVNPIAYAVVELLGKKGNILTVRGIDAIEGTPVIDIKPYIPGIDAKPDARIGWLKGKTFSRE